jgi:hypothetical protein
MIGGWKTVGPPASSRFPAAPSASAPTIVISQIPDLQKNADGSVDLYFRPAAPAGKESNWVPTKSQREFEIMFRAYAPTKVFFEKT